MRAAIPQQFRARARSAFFGRVFASAPEEVLEVVQRWLDDPFCEPEELERLAAKERASKESARRAEEARAGMQALRSRLAVMA